MIALVILGEYGRNHPRQALSCFQRFLTESNKTLQHLTFIAFKRIADKHPDDTYRFLFRLILNRNKHVRNFVCQALSVYGHGKPHQRTPGKVLRIAHWFMKDGDLSIKQALGKTLGELSKKHPEEVFAFFNKELPRGNIHTYWVIYRAAHALVKNKKFKTRTLELLNITTYHIPRK